MSTAGEENERRLVAFRGWGVMVWGISGQEKTSLVIVNGNVTAQWHRSHSASDCPAISRTAVTWCPSSARPRSTPYSQNPTTHPWCQHRRRGAAVCTLARHVLNTYGMSRIVVFDSIHTLQPTNENTSTPSSQPTRTHPHPPASQQEHIHTLQPANENTSTPSSHPTRTHPHPPANQREHIHTLQPANENTSTPSSQPTRKDLGQPNKMATCPKT